MDSDHSRTALQKIKRLHHFVFLMKLLVIGKLIGYRFLPDCLVCLIV